MRAIVINLKSRRDRLEKFKENNSVSLAGCEVTIFEAIDGRSMNFPTLEASGFSTDKNWRDPLLKRTLTWGEVGCFLSHYKAWELIADQTEPVMVLEDDAILTGTIAEIDQMIQGHDLLYLAHSEQKTYGRQTLSDNLVKPCYPYWTSAYVITPEGAAKLLDTDITKSIIPVDEYMPRMTDRLDVIAAVPPLATPVSRAELGTDVEPTSETDYVVDFETHVVTCGDNPEKMRMLEESSGDMGILITNVLKNEWEGGSMAGPGGGQKLNELRSWILESDLPDNDVVLFVDAFDVFFQRDLRTIVGRYLGFRHDVVFGAEAWLWPDKSLRFPPSHTKYRYLNSGTFIGRVGTLKQMLAEPLENSADDQLYLQKAFLSGCFSACLDYEGYLFQTNEPECVIKKGAVMNPVTKCYGCIYHGNGGGEAKATLERLFRGVFPEQKYAKVTQFEVIAPEMLLIDFMTPEQCQEWIDISERHNGWAPHPDDKHPSHDIHLKSLGLWDEIEAHWRRTIAPVTDKFWQPSVHHQLRKAFTMKYSPDTQTSLSYHNDASLVTGSVKLNNDYEGATLIFPRQKIDNSDVPIGKMILFPGQLTHGHFVEPLTKGTKYSLTLWTSRFKGDVLDPE